MSKPCSRTRLPIVLMTLGLLVVLVAAACAGAPAGPAPVPPSATPGRPTATLAASDMSPATASAVVTETLAAQLMSPTPTLAGPSPETLPAPTDTPAADPGATPAVSFARDVLPIIQANCTRCHGGSRPVAGLNLDGYDAIAAYASYGLVVPGDSANSILVEIISYGMMPPGGAPFPPQSLRTISDWIQAGAQNN